MFNIFQVASPDIQMKTVMIELSKKMKVCLMSDLAWGLLLGDYNPVGPRRTNHNPLGRRPGKFAYLQYGPGYTDDKGIYG